MKKDSNYYKGVKIRIYPNVEQKNQINMNFGHCRFTWNYMLDLQNKRYKNGEKHLSKFDMIKMLPNMKRGEYPWLKDADSTSLQQVCINLDLAYKRLFKHLGRKPRFKSKKVYAQSYTSSIINGKSIEVIDEHHIKLPKLGHVRTNKHAKINGKIKAATVKRSSAGNYYVVLRLEFEPNQLSQTQKVVGLDMGVADLIITSDGQKYETKRFDNKMKRKLRLWERRFARRSAQAKRASIQEKHNFKKLGKFEQARNWWEFKNVRKAKFMVAKLREKVANQRSNYIQNITTELVRRYDEIHIEDLKTKNLLKNHHLSKAIANQAWRMIRTQLDYKCKWYGKKLVVVNPYKTSQICANCGYDDGYHDLSIREWVCPKCHMDNDRDINAAKNIMLAKA